MLARWAQDLRNRFARGPVDRPALLRRLKPLYPDFGFGRGWPIDRHYIDGFLEAHAADIRGEVLEAGSDPDYTRRFGGDRVTRGHYLFPIPDQSGGTIVGDLASGAGIPVDAFDCALLTQVYQFIYDMPAAVRTTHAALRDGGVLLATMTGIGQISVDDTPLWDEYWRATPSAARRMFGDVFGPQNVTVHAYGNVLAAVCGLHGLVTSDLEQRELDFHDPEYPMVVAVRAVKAA